MPTVTEILINNQIVKPVAENLAYSSVVSKAKRKNISGIGGDLDTKILTGMREAGLASQVEILPPETREFLVNNLTKELKEFKTDIYTQLGTAEITINNDFSVLVKERKASTALTTEQVEKKSLSMLPHDVAVIIHEFAGTKKDTRFTPLMKAARLFLYSGIDFLTGLGKTTKINPESTRDTKLIAGSYHLKKAIADKGGKTPFVESDPITELDLSRVARALTDEMLIKIVSSNPGLKSINLSGCWNLTDAGIMAVANGCPGLERLNVRSCWNLTDAAIKAVAKKCKDLKQLDVSCCKNFTDAAIKAIAEHCSDLQQLNALRCPNLTDAAIIAVANGCKDLQLLGVSECDKLTDDAMRAVAKNCPGLQYLDVSGCGYLTNAAMRVVAEKCRGLQHIDVMECWKLTDAAMHQICNSHPNQNLKIIVSCSIIKRTIPAAIATSFAERYAGEDTKYRRR